MTKVCFRCKKEQPISEYIIRKDRATYHSYCKTCNVAMIDIQRREMKQKCIDYKGGKCRVCGYNKCNRALEFHHVDPTTKDFSIAWIRTNGWKTVKAELDKCVLLCSNCHAEVHDDVTSSPPL